MTQNETEVVLSATGATSVTIWCNKIDHNIDKKIVNVPVARSADGSGNNNKLEGEKDSWLIDLGRIDEMITVQGFLPDESSESGLEKKNNLIELAKNYRNVTLSWGRTEAADSPAEQTANQQSFSGNINKVQITETPGIIADGSQKSTYESEKNFAVQLSFVVGTDKLA